VADEHAGGLLQPADKWGRTPFSPAAWRASPPCEGGKRAGFSRAGGCSSRIPPQPMPAITSTSVKGALGRARKPYLR
jgi:hypothetical protein